MLLEIANALFAIVTLSDRAFGLHLTSPIPDQERWGAKQAPRAHRGRAFLCLALCNVLLAHWPPSAVAHIPVVSSVIILAQGLARVVVSPVSAAPVSWALCSLAVALAGPAPGSRARPWQWVLRSVAVALALAMSTLSSPGHPVHAISRVMATHIAFAAACVWDVRRRQRQLSAGRLAREAMVALAVLLAVFPAVAIVLAVAMLVVTAVAELSHLTGPWLDAAILYAVVYVPSSTFYLILKWRCLRGAWRPPGPAAGDIEHAMRASAPASSHRALAGPGAGLRGPGDGRSVPWNLGRS